MKARTIESLKKMYPNDCISGKNGQPLLPNELYVIVYSAPVGVQERLFILVDKIEIEKEPEITKIPQAEYEKFWEDGK
jgi:hypothetical protein